MYEHVASVKNPKKALSTPVSKHFTTENHSHQHMRFSVIEWLGNHTGPDIMRSRRKHELKYLGCPNDFTNRHQPICIINYISSGILCPNITTIFFALNIIWSGLTAYAYSPTAFLHRMIQESGNATASL